MPDLPARQATQLLQELCRGKHAPEQDLFGMLYERLRAIAANLMQRERGNHTLQPTALVHEAWMDLVDQELIESVPIEEARARFVGLAAHAMRRVLVDHARHRGREKRGGAVQRVTLTPDMPLQDLDTATVLDLEVALAKLCKRSERLGRIAELRLFGGLTNREIAPLLGVALTTVKDDWAMAKAMLTSMLAD